MKKSIHYTWKVLDRSERKHFLGLAFADVFVSLLDIVSLFLLLWTVHRLVQPNSQGSFGFLPNQFFSIDPLIALACILLIFCFKNTGAYVLVKAQHRLSAAVAIRISENNLKRYQQSDFVEYVQVDSSEHIRKIAFQPFEFCQHVLSGLQQMITQASLVLISAIGIMLVSAKLFLLLMAILLPPAAFCFYLVKKQLQKTRVKIRTSNEKSYRFLFDALKGYVEANIFHRNDFFLRRFVHARREFSKNLFSVLSLQSMPARLIEIFAVVGLVTLVLIARWTGDEQDSSFLTVGAFMTAAYKIIPGLVKLINIGGQVKAFEYLPGDLTTGGLSLPNDGLIKSAIYSVDVKGLCFKYQDQTMLERFSLSMQRGDFIGINGRSGKGKTTLLNLLLGFLPQQAGEILLNDLATDAEDRKAFWSAIAYVRQQNFLIHDSILRNITLEENGFDESRLSYAVKESGLDEVIKQFPEGLEKVISENGKNISGGQQQRIALARALYKNADLILLDEPFNELDKASEIKLLKHFRQLSDNGKIVVMITHNQASLRYCSKTISLDED